MKVNVFSNGRFHIYYISRELSKLGHDVKYYTSRPKWRVKKFGMKSKNIHSYFWLVAPLYFVLRLFPKQKAIYKIIDKISDLYLLLFARKAEILLFMCGGFTCSVKKAKNNNSVVICHTGSKHSITRMNKLLPVYPEMKSDFEKSILREQTSYEIADYIYTVATHARDSFYENGIKSKVICNISGVDVNEFYPLGEKSRKYDLINVGNFSLRKGADLLTSYVEKSEYNFLHVGALSEKIPEFANVTHVDPVNQGELIKYYNSAKVFVFPSREEGLATVQVQALACGLPIVCTKDSGGEDLKEFLKDPDRIVVMNEITESELSRCVEIAIKKPVLHDVKDIIDLEKVSWTASGKRYELILQQILNG